MSIAVVAGLGNPGLKYRKTRHNIGFHLIDKFAAKLAVKWKTEPKFEAETAVVSLGARKLLLVKPQTFMNASGRSLGAILRYRKLTSQSLLVIYDDITLDLARAKLSCNGSAGGHNGITDLLENVGPGFFRYRIGVGEKSDKNMDLADYVLSRFSKAENAVIDGRIPDYIEHLQQIIHLGPEPAMQFINQRKAPKHERSDNKEL
ncbi:MAG: aminoacyl-tRNA hydrolase [Verrucomicrobiota bacterium]